MLSLESTDRVSGSANSGAIILNQPISGEFELRAHHMELADIPWSFPGVDRILVRDNTSLGVFPIDIGLQIADDVASVIIALDNAFGPVLGTAVHEPANKRYKITIAADSTLLWSNLGSTARKLFRITADTTGLVHFLPEEFMNKDPQFLHLHFDEVLSQTVTSSDSRPDLIIDRKNERDVLGQKLRFQNTQTLNYRFYRTNLPLDTVPFTNEWHLIFHV